MLGCSGGGLLSSRQSVGRQAGVQCGCMGCTGTIDFPEPVPSAQTCGHECSLEVVKEEREKLQCGGTNLHELTKHFTCSQPATTAVKISHTASQPRIGVCVTRLHCVVVWFGFIRFALLVAVVLKWAGCWFYSWAFLGVFCLLLCVTQSHCTTNSAITNAP